MFPKVSFAVNLRADTFTDTFSRALAPWGWLAAPSNLSRSVASSLQDARRTGQCKAFIADNGNFELIGSVRAVFAARAAALQVQMADVELRLGRSARRRDLPPALASAFDKLAGEVLDHASAMQSSQPSTWAAQAALAPTHRIGVEDIGMACLLALDIERERLGWSRTRYRTMNAKVAARARTPPEEPGPLYTVASAMDYDTAFDAGREFAQAEITHVAMGFGAYMSDNHSIDRLVIGRRRIELGQRLPARYLRTVVVARGFVDGYAKYGHAGSPVAFHLLGLGQPILIGLVTRALDAVEALSCDAMSPIKDAVEGTLYVDKPALLKVRTRKVADRMSRDPTVRWDCPCPFCKAFVQAHPFDPLAARAWRLAHPTAEVDAAALRPGSVLYDALPLLAEPASGSLRKAVNTARMGHNHWVLQRVCSQLQTQARRGRLDAYVEGIVDAYGRATSQPRYARAVQLGLDIARG
jgi:hypothetical protein